MSFQYDAAKAKRRATICLLCTDSPAYMGQKHRVVTHILVNHVSVSRTPYFCTLCQFRCTNMDTLKQHVNFHRPHQTLKDSFSALPDKDYFLISDSPYFPQAGRDFKLLPRQRPGLGTTIDPVELSSGSSTGGVSPPTVPTCVIPERPVGRTTVYCNGLVI
ncbi:Hypothetical predicted protein [Mytilus galloprovincialis]|uniref:C2H2-type domain-containing protein n=1 Tax=Mytilus galloprovincialis TaxID=29158 RepID=A0A8B6G6P5_MYTGA|nr:Hypothetical predicted protein [Mytilus galloprovincialis]